MNGMCASVEKKCRKKKAFESRIWQLKDVDLKRSFCEKMHFTAMDKSKDG
jgi:hypothetical protein